MYRVEVPRADLALLLYLAGVTAVLGLFALAFCSLMRPTVIPNAGLAGYKAPGPAALFLNKPDASSEAMERAAVAAARADNKNQGIEPLRAFASLTPSQVNAARSTTAATLDGASRAGASQDTKQAKKAKPKRVARQETFADPRLSSWNSPWQSRDSRSWNNRTNPFGGRPIWGGRDRF
jgi:hypothetical protein